MGAFVRRLGSGQDFGSASVHRVIGDVTLVRCAYAARTKTPRHFHERPYFGFVLAGAFTESYSGRTLNVTRGQMAFHPAGEGHATDVVEDLHIIRLELGAAFSTRATTAALLERSAAVVEMQDDGIGRRLVEEFQQPDALTPLVVEGLSLELLGHFARSERRRAVPSWLSRIREQLREECGRAYTVTALARDAGVHPGHLARVFRQHYGGTIGEIIRQERIAFACGALATTEQPLVEIALAAGYSSQSHFSASFRRATGRTPAMYRRECRVRDKR